MREEYNVTDPEGVKHPYWISGLKFVKWGLGFFIFGLLLGFGVLIHYLAGSTWNVSNRFLSNVTLWFGSPLSLSATYLQVGGLGMVAVGAAKLWLARYWNYAEQHREGQEHEAPITHHQFHGQGSLILAIVGLIALFVTGYLGYFIIDGIWPGFYYIPIDAGKNLWLILQGLSLLCYFLGIVCAFSCLCKCCSCCKVCNVRKEHIRSNQY